jgi:hypothetical protein
LCGGAAANQQQHRSVPMSSTSNSLINSSLHQSNTNSNSPLLVTLLRLVMLFNWFALKWLNNTSGC